MDVSVVLSQGFSSVISLISGIELKSLGGFIQDIAVAFSAVWAAWAGSKGVHKYLLDEDIRERAKKIRTANEIAHITSSEVLYEIDSISIDAGPTTDADIRRCLEWSEKLCKATQGASSSVQTSSFLLRQLFLVVKPRYESGMGGFHVISNIDIFNIVYSVSAQIAYDAALIVDVPEHPVKSNNKRDGAARFILPEATVRFSSGRYGLDLRPHSESGYEFYLAVNRTSSYMLRKECLAVMRSNIPAVLELFEHGIYVPPILFPDPDYRSSSLHLGSDEPVYLIGAERIDYVGARQGVFWKVMYSRLHGRVRYTDPSKYITLIKDNYWDPVTNSKKFNKNLEEFAIYPEDVLVIEMNNSDIEKLKGFRKWQLKQWLKKSGVSS